MSLAGAVKSLIVLGGAGFAGTYALSNDSIRALISDVSKVIMSHAMQPGSLVANRPGGKSDDLSRQVTDLAEQVKCLISQRSSSNIVVHSGSRGSFRPSLLMTVSIGTAIAVVYFSGRGLENFLPVTARKFGEAILVVYGKIEDVKKAVQEAKDELSRKLESMRRDTKKDLNELGEKIDTSTAQLQTEVEGVRGDIGDVRLDVSTVSGQVGDVQKLVRDLDSKIDASNKGIRLLCSVVSEAAPKEKTSVTWKEMDRFMNTDLSPTCSLSRSSSETLCLPAPTSPSTPSTLSSSLTDLPSPTPAPPLSRSGSGVNPRTFMVPQTFARKVSVNTSSRQSYPL